MMSEETAERYRRMTPSERLKITLDMIRENTPYLLEVPPEVVKRRFERIRRQNDERNQRMLEGIARTRERDDEEYMRGWAQEMGVLDALDNALEHD